MKIKAEEIGEVQQGDNIKGSTVQREGDQSAKIEIDTKKLDKVHSGDNIEDSKIGKGWLLIALAIVATIGTILVAYFSK